METILVSACLLGDNVKYDGKNNYDQRIEALKDKYDIVPICPEVFGGLKTPRTPSEIKNGDVIDRNGRNVTEYFQNGAHKVLNIVNYMHVKKAVLMDRSPSCGVHQIYNGRFNGTLINGLGVCAKLLKQNGVEIYTIDEIDQLINED
ncbi:MAG: DUF523 domain-containing protein [Candidatus Onthovivens sp.]|nr:DUF523 domain-containing protein [bacterium]